MPNGNDALVMVELLDDFSPEQRFEVGGVREIPRDKRRREVYHEPSYDSYEYRRLDLRKRKAYVQDFYRNLLGAREYARLLHKAWELMEPDEQGVTRLERMKQMAAEAETDAEG
jgi:hypothetical protein